MDSLYFTNSEPPTTRTFSRVIFLNQEGFAPNGRKRAVIKVPCEKFDIENEYGTVVYSGETVHFGYDECSGDDVYIADFSDFHSEGVYTLVTDNGERSLSFTVGSGVYRPVLDKLVKAFYYLRCGSELPEQYAGKFARPTCHTEKAVEYGGDGTLFEVSGGWHDAGDYGRYTTTGACAAAHLMYAYKLFPDVFDKQQLGIPSQGVPDVLAEAKYELDWLLKMQRPDGSVWHKLTTMRHAPFVMPHEDKERLYLFPPSSMAAADLAAVCALGAMVFSEKDPRYSEKLKAAAELSWKWLEENPEFIGFSNPEGCNTGNYSERTDVDNRFWAAAQLYALTGEEKYHTAVDDAMIGFSMSDIGWNSVGGLGSLALLTSGRELSDRLRARIKRDFNSKAEELKGLCLTSGYGAAMGSWHYIWGSSMNLLKHAMIFIITDIINEKPAYSDCIAAQLDYLLGCNATGFSFISGCGEFSINSPHLRPTFADGIDECIPGYVSGGPNANPSDYDAAKLIPQGTPPMKCFADCVSCYSLNEVAIYWNSPAVFLLAYMADRS